VAGAQDDMEAAKCECCKMHEVESAVLMLVMSAEVLCETEVESRGEGGILYVPDHGSL